MSSVKISGNASGTGTFTISSPNSNTDRTITLPDNTGTILTTGSQIEFGAGTVSAPSISTSGDTNTGIFFPAADTIAFAEGGAEAMRIDSSGNVSVNTTSAPSKFNVYGDIAVGLSSENLGINFGPTGNTARIQYNGNGNFEIAPRSGYSTVFLSGPAGSERMRIDSSGNVLIGATSGLGRLHVYGSGQYSDLIMKTANVSTALFSDNTNALGVVGTTSNHPMLFYTNNGERMRITSGGDVQLSTAGTKILNSSGRPILQQTGSVLQVVNAAYSTSVNTTSTSYVDTGLTASITPTSTSSKILVIVTQTLSPITAGSNTFGLWKLLRGSTGIYEDARINMYMQYAHSTYSCCYLDSPATTSSTTYKTQMATGSALYNLEAQHAGLRTSTITLLEIAQ